MLGNAMSIAVSIMSRVLGNAMSRAIFWVPHVMRHATRDAGRSAQPDNTTARPATGGAEAAMTLKTTRVRIAPPAPTKAIRAIGGYATIAQLAMTLASNGKAVEGRLTALV